MTSLKHLPSKNNKVSLAPDFHTVQNLCPSECLLVLVSYMSYYAGGGGGVLPFIDLIVVNFTLVAFNSFNVGLSNFLVYYMYSCC